ncbi:hypothetical protein V8C26DRAFT_413827 [Trichoderma gracile]
MEGHESDRWRMQERRLSLEQIDDQGNKDRMVRCWESAKCLDTYGWPNHFGSSLHVCFGLLVLHLLCHFPLKPSIACATARPPDVRVRWHGPMCKMLQAWRMSGQCSASRRRLSRHAVYSTISAHVLVCLSLQTQPLPCTLQVLQAERRLSPPRPSTKTNSVIVYRDHTTSMRSCRHCFVLIAASLPPPPSTRQQGHRLTPPLKLDPYFHISQALQLPRKVPRLRQRVGAMTRGTFQPANSHASLTASSLCSEG